MIMHSSRLLQVEVVCMRDIRRFKLYSSLFEANVEAFPRKSKRLCQQEVNEKWNTFKEVQEKEIYC